MVQRTNILRAIMDSPSVGDRATKFGKNRLAQILQPLQAQQAKMNVQEQRNQMQDADRERVGKASALFLSALGDDYANIQDPAQQAQRWQMAKQATQQAGFDLSPVPDQPSQEWLGIAQRFGREYGAGAGPKVGAQEILPDGTVIQSTDSGVRVMSPDGNVLQGEQAANAIRQAREFGIDVQQRLYQGRREGTLSADVSLGRQAEAEKESGKQDVKQSREVGLETFQQAREIRKSLPLFDEAIAALDAGAETGAIASYLPTIRNESKRLENIQNRLGLSIIQSTTFGALSEAEMRLAMETAIPTGLNEPQLKKWLQEKKSAQIRAAEALENASAALLSGEMTLGDLAKTQAQSNKKPSKPVTELSDDELIEGL